MAYSQKRWLAPLNKGFRGWNTEVYKGYLLRFEKMKNGYYGVLAFKDGKPQVVSSGYQQYIGVGKTKRDAMADAKTSVDLWR
jgi:hypothetical protein